MNPSTEPSVSSETRWENVLFSIVLNHDTLDSQQVVDRITTETDDLFGYGLIDDGKALEAWWDLESSTRGVDSRQGRRIGH